MSDKPDGPSYSVASLIGSAGGVAAGGLVHSVLPAASGWLRAAATGGSVAVVGGLLSFAVVYFTSRKSRSTER